jgi:hypothetical protein
MKGYVILANSLRRHHANTTELGQTLACVRANAAGESKKESDSEEEGQRITAAGYSGRMRNQNGTRSMPIGTSTNNKIRVLRVP